MYRGWDLGSGPEYSVEEFLPVLEESLWLYGCQYRDLVNQIVVHMQDEDYEMPLLILLEE